MLGHEVDHRPQLDTGTKQIPAVAESLKYLTSEFDNLAEGLFQMQAIVDRITGISAPPSEAGVADNPNGLLGDINAITQRVRAATTLLRDQNARLAELF